MKVLLLLAFAPVFFFCNLVFFSPLQCAHLSSGPVKPHNPPDPNRQPGPHLKQERGPEQKTGELERLGKPSANERTEYTPYGTSESYETEGFKSPLR